MEAAIVALVVVIIFLTCFIFEQSAKVARFETEVRMLRERYEPADKNSESSFLKV